MTKNKNRVHRNRSIKYIPTVVGAGAGIGSSLGVSYVPQVASLSLPLIVLILCGGGLLVFGLTRLAAEFIARKFDTNRMDKGIISKQMLGERVIDSSIRSKKEAVAVIETLKKEQDLINRKMNSAQATLRYFKSKVKYIDDIEPVQNINKKNNE